MYILCFKYVYPLGRNHVPRSYINFTICLSETFHGGNSLGFLISITLSDNCIFLISLAK